MNINKSLVKFKLLISSETRKEFLTSATLAITTITNILFLGIMTVYYFKTHDTSGFSYFVTFGIVSGIGWYAAKIGYWFYAARLPTLMFFLLGVYGSFVSGFATNFTIYYVISFMLAGLLVNKRAMLFFAFFNFATHITIIYINHDFSIREDMLAGFIVLLAGFTGVFLIQWLYLTVLDNTFAQSLIDPVTHVQNRNYFDATLNILQKSRRYPISILMVDVDGLKKINDSMGHSFGDELIKRTAECLQLACRADDIICRIGGDEFGVIFTKTDNLILHDVIKRISEQLERNNQKYPEMPLHFSIGEASATSQDNLLETLKLADTRMYANKKEYKKCTQNLSL